MSILDSEYMGTTVDELDSDIEQSELNLDLLVNYDRSQVFECIKNRISFSNLEYILGSVEINDNNFWIGILDEAARVYSLNYLKMYSEDAETKDKLGVEVIKFLLFIKIKLIDLVERKEIDIINMNRENLENYLIITKAPDILVNAIRYIDGESYKKFIKRIVIETKLDFM